MHDDVPCLADAALFLRPVWHPHSAEDKKRPANLGGVVVNACQIMAYNGARGTRTLDLLHAMQTRSQLRHGPSQVDYAPRAPSMQLRFRFGLPTGPGVGEPGIRSESR